MVDVATKIVRDPASMICGDTRWYSERSVTQIDDWRETIIGPVNFGMVIFGPATWRKEPVHG